MLKQLGMSGRYTEYFSYIYGVRENKDDLVFHWLKSHPKIFCSSAMPNNFFFVYPLGNVQY